MSRKIKIGSLFDGSGGFPLAATLCGITPAWASEVEPYPIAVTKSRFPQMVHLGDVSKINGAKIEPVDVITFGSPCQDLSVAGKRAGLKHEVNGDEETTRSGLFMDAVRIIKEMRDATNGLYPAFAVWENVPGAFSSNGGKDFRIVLEELIKIVEPTATMPAVPKAGWAYADSYVGDGWSLAYRVLDAQFWGVAQRRRRIYLVADFRGGRAREILFKRESLRWYFTESGTPWERTAADAERGIETADRAHPYLLKIRSGCEGGGKGALVQEDMSATLATNNDQYLFQPLVFGEQGGQQITVREDGEIPTLRAEMHGNAPCVMQSAGFKAGQSKAGGLGWQKETAATLSAQASGTEPTVCYSVENHPADSRVNIDDSGKVQTLTSRMGTGGGNVPMVMEQKVYGISSFASNAMLSSNPRSGIYEAKTSRTLDLNGGNPACNQGGIAVVLASGKDTVATLMANAGTNLWLGNQEAFSGDYHIIQKQETKYIVRRLTPTECARLQGFPDDWGHPDQKEDFTDEEYRFWLEVRNTHATINGKAVKDYTPAQMLTWYNKLHTDSAEYKMWGNGIALPTALYVMQGIAEVCNGHI